MKKLARLLRRAADKIDPLESRNPATVLGALAPEIPRDRIKELEAYCEAPVTIEPLTLPPGMTMTNLIDSKLLRQFGEGVDAEYLLLPDGKIVRNPARGA